MKRIMLIAVVAMLTLAGTAYSASKITGAQIKDGTITGRDVKNKSLTTADFSGSVQGPAGIPGPVGPAGPAGPAGPTVVGKLTTVYAVKTIAAGAIDGVTVACPAGQRVVSGGFMTYGGPVWLSKSYDGVSWTAGVDNYDWSIATEAQVYASCAPAGVAIASSAGSTRNTKIARDIAAREDARK